MMADTTISNDVRRAHWDTMAAHWRRLGPPLRPSEEDLAIVRRVLLERAAAPAHQPLRGMLLGVTPEIASLPWPAGSSLLAVERSEVMIRAVWPGDVPGRRRAEQADWIAAPVEAGTCDLLLGDASHCNLDFPDGYRRFAQESVAWLAADARAVFRMFFRPARHESPHDVFAALEAGAFAGFHAFKLRLAMSVLRDGQANVRLGDVWQVWADAKMDPRHLAARTGWPVEVVQTIDLYRGKDARLSFPTLDEYLATVADGFKVESMHTPGYELGERCPTLVLRKR